MKETIETQAFGLHVTIGKLKTMADTVRHTMYFDMNEVDETAQALMLKNHEEHCNLFAIMEDYILELEEQITALNESVN